MIHRVWLGSEIPDQLQAFGRSWEEHHPTWEHRLWTEANLPSLRNQDLFDRAEEIAPRNVGQLRADLVRYEILLEHGGVYVDCDFECLRPLDELLAGVSCFAALEDARWVNNAIMGAPQLHPFVEALVDGLPENIRRTTGRPNKLSGPQYLTPIARRFGITIFPRELFYPYSYTELERGGEEFPDAYAIHHWSNRRRERQMPLPARNA